MLESIPGTMKVHEVVYRFSEPSNVVGFKNTSNEKVIKKLN